MMAFSNKMPTPKKIYAYKYPCTYFGESAFLLAFMISRHSVAKGSLLLLARSIFMSSG